MRKTIPILTGHLLWALHAHSQDIPFVFGIKNTGGDYSSPPLPEIEDLPLIAPLPKPFTWSEAPLDEPCSSAYRDGLAYQSGLSPKQRNRSMLNRSTLQIVSDEG